MYTKIIKILVILTNISIKLFCQVEWTVKRQTPDIIKQRNTSPDYKPVRTYSYMFIQNFPLFLENTHNWLF